MGEEYDCGGGYDTGDYDTGGYDNSYDNSYNDNSSYDNSYNNYDNYESCNGGTYGDFASDPSSYLDNWNGDMNSLPQPDFGGNTEAEAMYNDLLQQYGGDLQGLDCGDYGNIENTGIDDGTGIDYTGIDDGTDIDYTGIDDGADPPYYAEEELQDQSYDDTVDNLTSQLEDYGIGDDQTYAEEYTEDTAEPSSNPEDIISDSYPPTDPDPSTTDPDPPADTEPPECTVPQAVILPSDRVVPGWKTYPVLKQNPWLVNGMTPTFGFGGGGSLKFTAPNPFYSSPAPRKYTDFVSCPGPIDETQRYRQPTTKNNGKGTMSPAPRPHAKRPPITAGKPGKASAVPKSRPVQPKTVDYGPRKATSAPAPRPPAKTNYQPPHGKVYVPTRQSPKVPVVVTGFPTSTVPLNNPRAGLRPLRTVSAIGSMNNYILRNYKAMGQNSSGQDMYRAPNGEIYVKNNSQWEVFPSSYL